MLSPLYRLVRERVRIRDVLAAAGVKVLQGGAFCCAVHGDKDPAGVLYAEGTSREHAHCHACGWHGDAIDLFAVLHGLTGPQALQELARRHGLEGGGRELVACRALPACTPTADSTPPPGPALAPVLERSRVYVALLAELSLDVAHGINLGRRGMSDEEVRRRMYRSLPDPLRRQDVARRLVRWFGEDLLAQVPGLVRRTSQRTGRPYWTIGGPPGMLVPVRDLHGRIVAMQARRDEQGDGPRYLWLSSTREGGPGSGAPVHAPLSLVDGHDLERVRLTEGPLKADTATCLDPDRLLTLGVPGVQTWRAALPVLEALGARIVHLAFDADWATNRHVARALLDAADGLEAAGFTVAIETWTTDGDGNPKGIDDLLVTGRLPEVIE